MAAPSTDDTLSPILTLDQAVAPAALGTTLPPGHQVQEFVIRREIGEGGFGIVYLAQDQQLGRQVAIKEYMPASLALRQATHQVSVRSERHRDPFELGLRSFMNEARLLASFDHPALVRIHRCWEDNGTAYMAMPYYEGPTLRQWLKHRPEPPDEAWLKAMLDPLTQALALMHAERCYHRDIAPDNILLVGPAAQPVLLDFGAARRVLGDATQALTSILKPGYAPIEQYAEVSTARQGPWTDVYALCAVAYLCMTGEVPVPSVGRLMKDELVPLRERVRGRYSPGFLSTIDDGLAVKPEDRIPDMATLRARVYPQSTPAPRRVHTTAPALTPLARTTVGAAHKPDDTTVMMPAPPRVPRASATTAHVRHRAAVQAPARQWPVFLAGAATVLAIIGGWRLMF